MVIAKITYLEIGVIGNALPEEKTQEGGREAREHVLQTVRLDGAMGTLGVHELVVERDEAPLERLKLFKRVFRDEARVEVGLELDGE